MRPARAANAKALRQDRVSPVKLERRDEKARARICCHWSITADTPHREL